MTDLGEQGRAPGRESLMRTLEACRSLAQTLKQHKYALTALLLPLTIRAIPEIIAGPYPIGYDTIAAYVPNTPDTTAGKWTV